METQQITQDKPKMTPGFFFLSLGLLIALIASVVSFLNLVFETLDKKFPDVLNASYQYGYYTYQYDAMRTALATLIIFFPVFLVVTYYWKKKISLGLGKTDEILRKWAVYIILFLSAIVVVIDLVTLVRYFVSGEITTRFILKVLSALVVALVVGGYYILLLRQKGTKKINIVFTLGSIALVLFAIVWSFMVMGSPSEQRLLRFDDKRVTDLQNIQWQVISYWQQKETLPKNLEELVNPISGYSLPVDPEFEKGINYEYAVKKDMTFELCATFSKPMPQGWQEYKGGGVVVPMMEGRDVTTSYPYPGGGTNESWDHKEGRTCFERTIDPEIYPPYDKR